MSISAIQNYHDALSTYKPQVIPDTTPDTALDAGAPNVRALTAGELSALGEDNPDYAAAATGDMPGFGEMVKGFVKGVNDKLVSSDEQTRDLMTGKTHDTGAVVSSVEEADLGLQFAVAFRSKIISAYQTLSQITY